MCPWPTAEINNMAEDSTFDPDLKLLTNFIRIGFNRNKEIRHSYEWLIPNKKHLQYKLRKVGELLLFNCKFELTKRE